MANKRTLENPLAGLELLGFRPQADEEVAARPRFADSKIGVKAPAANRFATSMVGGKDDVGLDRPCRFSASKIGGKDPAA